MLTGLKFCFNFLTRIPIKAEIEGYSQVANKIYLFPIVGFITGLIVGFLGYILSLIFHPFLVSILTVALLIYITGAHHLDGLMDFGDGLMTFGSPQKKIDAMHDVAIGTGGFSLAFVILIATVFSIASSLQFIFAALIISEITAKFSMVLICSYSKSANTPMATEFIKLNNWKRSLFSFFILVPLIFIGLYLNFFIYYFLPKLFSLKFIRVLFGNLIITIFLLIPIIILSLMIALASMLFIRYLSYQNFKGVTGDCIGALHEITRLITLIVIFLLFSNVNLYKIQYLLLK